VILLFADLTHPALRAPLRGGEIASSFVNGLILSWG